MVTVIIFVVVLALLLAVAAGVVFCVWIFWASARAIPPQLRMRWPWLIWLLLLPFQFSVVDQILPLLTLLPLTRSYRRFFKENKISGGGDCGFGLAVTYWLLSLLDLLFLCQPLGWMPPQNSPALRTFAMDILTVSVLGRAVGWVLLLFLAVRMWFLRRAVLNIQGQPAGDVGGQPPSLNLLESRRKKVSIGLLLAMVVLLAADQAWIHAWQIIPVRRDTTYLLGPISKDGGVDYVAALNAMESKGVTLNNNALPLLIEAAGPKCFHTKYGDGKWVMRKLGMKAFAKNAESLITFTHWLKEHPIPLPKTRKKHPKWILESRLENRLTQHAWTAAKYPAAALWIKTNQRALRLFSQAMNRPRYYIPLHSGDGSVIGINRPDAAMVDSLRTVVCADAMFLLGNGKTAQASREARNVHRLARLFSQAPGMMSYLQTISFDTSALALDRALANSGQLSDQQLRRLLAHLKSRSQLPALATVLSRERYNDLDNLARTDRDGLASAYGPSTLIILQQYFLPVNYPRLMRDTNRLFNSTVAAAKVRNFRKQLSALHAADARFRAYSGDERIDLGGTIQAPRLVVFGGSTANLVLRSLFVPLDVWISTYNRNFARVDWLRGKLILHCRLTELSLALAIYHKLNGHYPSAVSALAPRYIRRLPHNIFTGKPVHYRVSPSGGGYRLFATEPAVTFGYSGANFGTDNTPVKAKTIQVRGGDWPRHAGK
jgi:hypothetical protein